MFNKSFVALSKKIRNLIPVVVALALFGTSSNDAQAQRYAVALNKITTVLNLEQPDGSGRAWAIRVQPALATDPSAPSNPAVACAFDVVYFGTQPSPTEHEKSLYQAVLTAAATGQSLGMYYNKTTTPLDGTKRICVLLRVDVNF
jgi:hypothetical protein